MVKAEKINEYRKLFPAQDKQQTFFSSSSLANDGINLRESELEDILRATISSVESLKTKAHSPILGGKVKPIDYELLTRSSSVPEIGETSSAILDKIVNLSTGHPFQTEFYMTNAIPIATNISIAGMVLGSLLNSNPIWDVYGPAAAECEATVVAMMSEVVGFNKNRSNGYFTYGGTGGNDAALRVALEKCDPGSREQGRSSNIYVLSNELSHFSVNKVVADSGIGTNKSIKIASKTSNGMNINELEKNMRDIIQKGGKIATIYATVGTTDGFGMDDISGIKRAIDSLVEEFKLDYRPHIHADLAMGGFFPMFNDYDFQNNPLDIDEMALTAIQQIRSKMVNVKDADSVIIDFHKMGFTPYLNSLFLVKDSNDLHALDIDKSSLVDKTQPKSPYIGERSYGDYHTLCTKECSRFFASIPAYLNLITLGKEGYQAILANSIERAEQLKQGLERIQGIKALNLSEPGPIAVFRFYENEDSYLREITGLCSGEEVDSRNAAMSEIMDCAGKNREKIFFGDTKAYRNVKTSNNGDMGLYAMKAFMISPFTSERTIEQVVDYIANLKQQVFNPRTERLLAK